MDPHLARSSSMESHFISLRGAGRLARCTLAGLLLILSAPAQAGCENSREILPGTLIDFDPPEAVFAGANGAGRRKYVVMQRLWVSTELDDRYDLPGRTTDRERAMMVAVCDRDLPLATVPTDGDIVACENAPDPTRNAPTTEGWRGAYYSPGGALWNGTTYAVPSPAPTVWIKGNYRAAEDIW
jgi:hypothetical protein